MVHVRAGRMGRVPPNFLLAVKVLMTTQRPFTHLILFTLVASLALLGGCASEGTKGAAGADGTIAVPSADTLTITASKDNHTTLGTITQAYTVVGLDNDTAAARERYYMYEGTSSTAKSVYWNISTTPTGLRSTGAFTNGVLDTRHKTADNITLSVSSASLNASNGSISHLIVCRGNEAGDASSCSAGALKDRGAGSAGKVVTTGDAKAFMVVPYGTSNFVSIRDNTTAVHVYNITDTKATANPAYGSTIAITTGSTGTGQFTSVVSNAGVMNNADPEDATGYANLGTGHTVDAIESNGTTYYATINGSDSDNISGAVYSYTSSGESTFVDNITYPNSTAGVGNKLVLAGTDVSSGDTIFAVTNHRGDNRTVSAYKLTSSTSTLWGTDNLTTGINAGDNASRTETMGFCADARYMSASGANTQDSSGDNATFFVAWPADNGSRYNIDSLSTPGGTWGTPTVFTANSDNTTASMCDMVVTKDTNDNGTLYLAAKMTKDNVTVYKVTNIDSLAAGNLSHLGSFQVTDNVTSLKVGHDSDDNSTVIVVNDNGNIELWRNYENGTADNFTHISAADSTGVSGDRVSLAVQPSKYAIGYMDSNDNASIKIWYDE